MSSFMIKATHRETGQVHDIWCMDDYYGPHIYAYIPNIEGGEAMKIDEFEKEYETSEDIS